MDNAFPENRAMNKGILYIVATPIGNLEDITLRAIKILKEANIVACEDTRTTKKLLNHFGIQTPIISFHQHSRPGKIHHLINKLKSGQNIALVTEAGTPGISDPGNILVAEAVKNNIKVAPIPGPSALGALISAAGIDTQKFIFLSFPPHKKGREKFFKEIVKSKYPIVYYESPHRLIKNLELLISLNRNKKIIVGRELTKLFEEIVRGSAEEILEYFKKQPEKIKGEFTIIIY